MEDKTPEGKDDALPVDSSEMMKSNRSFQRKTRRK